jgi:chromate transporter
MGSFRSVEGTEIMDRVDLGGLFLHLLMLWFVAIGGPSTIFPEIHRYLVEANQLVTNAQFAELYTLAQVAPGPNAMYVTLIGWHLAGWRGVVATTIPLLVPAATLTLLVGHLNQRYPNARFGRAIRLGLMPITIGLVFASATILMRTVNHDWRGYVITFVTVAVVLRKPWNPLWLFAGGALAGMLEFL